MARVKELTKGDRLAILQQAIVDYGQAGGEYLITVTETAVLITLPDAAIDNDTGMMAHIGDPHDPAVCCSECGGVYELIRGMAGPAPGIMLFCHYCDRIAGAIPGTYYAAGGGLWHE